MLKRIGYGLIFLFWATMLALLIRSEIIPEETALSEVPVEIVLKQFFHPDQASDLFIYSDGSRVGHLHLKPKQDDETKMRTLDFNGNLQLDLPEGARERASWEGKMELSKRFELQSFHVKFAVRDAAVKELRPTKVDLTLLASEKKGSYRYQDGDRVVADGSFTLDEKGLEQLLDNWGIPPELHHQISLSKGVAPTITCRVIRMKIHEAETEGYLVTVAGNGQTLLELRLSQLGQIIDGTTPFGWTLNVE